MNDFITIIELLFSWDEDKSEIFTTSLNYRILSTYMNKYITNIKQNQAIPHLYCIKSGYPYFQFPLNNPFFVYYRYVKISVHWKNYIFLYSATLSVSNTGK